jgi:translation initiation factor IF-3
VKAVVQFSGRESANVDLVKKLLQRFAADLTEHGTIEGQPKREGRNAHVIIRPAKKDIKEKAKKPSAPPPANPGLRPNQA